MALLALMQQWQKHTPEITLIALTVDHGLRPEAKEEAERVHQWCRAHNIPHHILRAPTQIHGNNLQEQARELRYRLLSDHCSTNHLPYLLTAHTEDDQAETVMMRLFRGSGVDGLSAIPFERLLTPKVTVLRPLLSHTRDELREFLRAHHIEWIEDPSNENTHFMRIQIRTLLANLPDAPRIKKRLANTAMQMHRARLCLEQQTRRALSTHVFWSEAGHAFLRPSLFESESEEIVLRSLRAILSIISGNHTPPRLSSLLPLYHDLKKQTTGHERQLHHVCFKPVIVEKKITGWHITPVNLALETTEHKPYMAATPQSEWQDALTFLPTAEWLQQVGKSL